MGSPGGLDAHAQRFHKFSETRRKDYPFGFQKFKGSVSTLWEGDKSLALELHLTEVELIYTEKRFTLSNVNPKSRPSKDS